jgi:GNAT superfamily N-acetyltransferase
MREGWVLRKGTLGPPPEGFLVDADGAMARTWKAPITEEHLDVDGVEGIRRRLTGFIPPNEELVQLILVHPEARLPIGWAHLRFRNNRCYLEELFVIKEMRGYGIGSTLIEWSLYEAVERGLRELIFLHLEADAVSAEVLGAAHLPARLQGLKWRKSRYKIWRGSAVISLDG